MPKHLTTDDSPDFVASNAVGAASGVAPLGEDLKVPSQYLPEAAASSVQSVNGKTGNVLLSASDVGGVAASAVGNPNGVAPLDGTGRMPSNKLPTTAVLTVNGIPGPNVTVTTSGGLTQAAADGRYVRQDSLVLNAKEHGAVIDGNTDDAPAINALLASAPNGATVYLPPGDVGIKSPIIVPPGKTLRGSRRNLMKAGLYDPLVRIKPLAGFVGSAAIRFLDQATGAYGAISAEQRVENLMIFGGNAPAGVDGIQAKGNVQNVELSCVTIRDMTGNGIYTGDNAGVSPYSWRLFKVMLDNNHGHGATFQLMTDLTMVDCQAIGNWAHGFVLNNAANSQLSTCRSEWNGNYGYYITGSWGTGTGSGGMQMSGCATDRNGWHGVFVDATGNVPVVISNLMTRRDGRNGGTGGGGYAGVAATNTTLPLIIGDWTNYPGTDDNGTQANSPQYGGSFTGNTSVQIDNAYLHANTAGMNNGGGNASFRLGANITYATGPTATPTRTVPSTFLPSSGGALTGPVNFQNAAPTANPANGVYLYAEGGVAKVRQSNGTIFTVGSGGGGGSAVGIAGAKFIVANNASAAEKARADYLCDGVADDVEIQAAINAAKAEGGGVVLLSSGNFVLANTATITGNTDEDNADSITLRGAGAQATTLSMAANKNGIELTNWAMANIEDLGIVVSGSGSCIHSTAVLAGNEVSFWHSSFRNLRLNGGFVGTNTGWGMDLVMPWRSTFENIEIEGTRNGMRLSNQGDVQNAGDCTFTRMFIEIVGTGGTAIHVSSPSNNMNQNNFNMVEIGANGTGCTGILIDGASGSASQRFWGLNAEQFQTTIHVANGESNVFDCNYITGDTGQPGNVMFKCGTNAYNNIFSSKWVNIAGGDTLKVIEDANTTSNCPNIFERIRLELNAGASATYSKTGSTVFREITTFNDGGTIQPGLLQYPLSTVNRVDFTHEDHGFLSWTADPGLISGAPYNLGTGKVYLSKLKIVNRSTVVSNIHYFVSVAGTALTAGQCYVGLYNASGTLLATSADQATAMAATGAKVAPITPQTLAVGNYYVAFLAVGTGTLPSVPGAAGNASITNIGLTTGTARALDTATGNTVLPGTITLGSQNQNAAVRWAALS